MSVAKVSARRKGLPERADRFRSEGEVLLAAYLSERGRAFQYETDLGGQRPDFLVGFSPMPVVCEVVDPTPFRPQPRPEGRAFGSMDPFEHIRPLIHRKRAQAASTAGELPYVLVIRPPNDVRPYEPISVIGAMFGDVAFSVPVGPAAPSSAATRLVTTNGGRMQPTLNTRFSAVAVIEKVNPTRESLLRAIRDEAGPARTVEEILEAGQRVSERMARDGTFHEELELPQVTVYHNPFAAVPLSLTFFDGPFDQQWADEGGMRMVLEGLHAYKLQMWKSDP